MFKATRARSIEPRLAASHRAKRVRVSPMVALLRDVAIVVVLTVVMSTLLRMFLVQVFWIPSASMSDTLSIDDKIAVSRIDAIFDNIERGDIVVFEDNLDWLSPSDEDQPSLLVRVGQFVGLFPSGDKQTLVKRVIGVGGDRITCDESGVLRVNDVVIEEPYVLEGQTSCSQVFDVTVPEGTLWVMGDNRSNSADSRYHRGPGQTPFVSVSSVVGTVQAIIWPRENWRWGLSEPEPFALVTP